MPGTANTNYGFKPKRKAKKKSMAAKLRSLEAKVSTMALDDETNYFCRQESGLPVDSTGLTRELTLVPQNDSNAGRTGDVIKPYHLTVRFRIGDADNNNIVRIVMVQYKGPGSTAGPSKFPIGGAALIQPLGCWSGDLRANHYRILYDNLFSVDADDPVIVGTIRVPLINSKQVHFDGSTATTADGGIMLFAISDSSVASHPDLSFVSSLSYKG